MNETWEPIPTVTGYEASDLGRIRSVDRVVQCSGLKGDYVKHLRGKILTPHPTRGGYLSVSPSRRTLLVHRLVLEAFVGPRPDGMHGLHRNGNHLDNRLLNLAWGTASENLFDQVRHGTHYLAQRAACPRGHLLQPPNLCPHKHWRECLACNRAMSRQRWLRVRRGVEANLQELSDAYYVEIMASAA